jgi:RNA polymerase sigma-70 factor (family 1)
MDDLRPGLDIPVYRKFETNISFVNEPGEDLVYPFNEDSREAFTAMYDKLYHPVFYFARRFVNREVAEDITADIFCKLWAMQKNFLQLQNIKVFLQVSVRNACLSYLEHEEVVERHKKTILLSSDEKTEDLFYEDEIKAEYLKQIFSAMEKLPAGQKKIFKLSYLDGLKEQEIADKLHISKSTVHTQRMRAIKRLRIGILPLNWLFPFFLLTFCNIY